MMVRAPVVESAEAPDEAAVLGTETAAELDVSAGDAVAVREGAGTAVRVAAVGPFSTGVALGDGVRSGVAAGETVTVESVDARAVTRASITTPPAVRLDGGVDVLRRALIGQQLTRGTTVRPTLLDGGVELQCTVTDVEPRAGGVVVQDTRFHAVGTGGGDGTGEYDRPGTDDVGGHGDALDALFDTVVEPLADPERYRRTVGQYPGHVLLSGPNGVGKTLLADVAGGASKARYFRVTHRQALRDEYGGFDALAAAAVRAAPAVVLLDGVDEMVGSDGRSNGSSRPAELGAFLDRLAEAPVVVVGTATTPDALPDALRRGGRLATDITVQRPDADGRRDILERLVPAQALGGGVDLASVAARANGFVGADLRQLVATAGRAALERKTDGEPSLTAADFERALQTVTPPALADTTIERPDVSYEDIGGLEDAKREVIRAVEWPLEFPELFDRLGSAPPTGVLLYGLPGTGKTLLARAVAAATDANFLSVDGPELLDRYVGESERGVRDVFERARGAAPAVIFFDEIDALAPARGGRGDTDVTERVVSQLLTELDGLEPRGEVVTIGATNRPDVLDPALLRPGRFGRLVEVPLPDATDRAAIFRVHLADVPTARIDHERLAAVTERYSGGDIAAAVREAGLLAVEDLLRSTDGRRPDPGALRVEMDHLERAVGIVSPSTSPAERQAYESRTDDLH